LRLASVAEIDSTLRPPEAHRRGGEITRFLEPERRWASGGLFELDG
jgi:hypothetical protein